jgi:hypothetical protein
MSPSAIPPVFRLRRHLVRNPNYDAQVFGEAIFELLEKGADAITFGEKLASDLLAVDGNGQRDEAVHTHAPEKLTAVAEELRRVAAALEALAPHALFPPVR